MVGKRIVTFSFDDGVTQDIRFVEVLNKYGLKCTFNLNSELLGNPGELIINGNRINHNKINSEDVRSVYSGHEIAAHTLTHPFLPDCVPEEVVRQVEEDRLKLSILAGYEVVGFAYPGGGKNYNEAVAGLIKEQTAVKYARTIESNFSFEKQADLFVFKPTLSLTKNRDKAEALVNDFFSDASDDDKLLYIWGHSYEFDVDDSWDYLEAFCEKISGRAGVSYLTNKDAFLCLGDL